MEGSTESWGPGRRFGIVPLADNKIYWLACTNAPAQDERMKNFTTQDLYHHFQDFHDPIPTLLHQTRDEELIWNDIIDLKPIDQYAFENIVLIGDTAHATTPNMGQGACQAIEDAVILASEIKKENDIATAFKSFEKRRMKKTHFIVNNSWTLGKVGQVENKLLSSLRNLAFRAMPASVNDRQMKKLYELDF
jgi:2-polyprenyl-6-methoxyphenol hydroxylase-like FAD-dependent oxidoreductase